MNKHPIMKESKELKHCPICGQKVNMFDYTKNMFGFVGYMIECEDCKLKMLGDTPILHFFEGNTVHFSFSKEKAEETKIELIARWNTRHYK